MEGPETTYKILFKNLSEIFFKNLIKNVVPAIKSLAYDKYKIKTNYVFFAKHGQTARREQHKNLNTLSYDLNFTPEDIKVKDKIKKNSLKEFKSSLSIFYLVANSKKLQKIKKVKNFFALVFSGFYPCFFASQKNKKDKNLTPFVFFC